jgi:ABC-type Na+ efflux pump permease subunit
MKGFTKYLGILIVGLISIIACLFLNRKTLNIILTILFLICAISGLLLAFKIYLPYLIQIHVLSGIATTVLGIHHIIVRIKCLI